LIDCGCGCKERLLKFDKKRRPRRYIHGHHIKSNDYNLWQRFINKVEIDPITECWNWVGAKQRHGYGTIGYKNKFLKAHRLSYEKFIGEIPNSKETKHGTCVCHSCDNPSCVNPDHLFLGTQKDNLQDMFNKKRNGQSLSFELHSKIQELAKTIKNKTKIAKLLGIHRSTVARHLQ